MDHRRHPFQKRLRSFRKFARRHSPLFDVPLQIGEAQWRTLHHFRRSYGTRFPNVNVRRLVKKLSRPERFGDVAALHDLRALMQDLVANGWAEDSDGDSDESGGPLVELWECRLDHALMAI